MYPPVSTGTGPDERHEGRHEGWHEERPLPPVTWRPLEAVPVFLISLAVSVILAAAVAGVHSCAARFTLASFIGEASLAGTVIVWVRYVNRGPLSALGAPREALTDVGVGVATGAGLILLAYLSVAVIRAVASSVVGHPIQEPQQVEICVRGGWLIALGPVVVLLAPFAEELFFRGFLFRALRSRFSLWPSAILSSVIFGAVHFQGVSYLLIIPGLAIVGLGLALLYERRQSVLATMAAHASFNLAGFLVIAFSRR